MSKQEATNSLIGKKIIETAINFDESLIEILKLEIKRIKQLSKNDNTLEELQQTNNLIKNIIMALIISDEKLRAGINLCISHKETQE